MKAAIARAPRTSKRGAKRRASTDQTRRKKSGSDTATYNPTSSSSVSRISPRPSPGIVCPATRAPEGKAGSSSAAKRRSRITIASKSRSTASEASAVAKPTRRSSRVRA
jgi:hypothetical protein